jgi:hypothetical protein
MLMVADPSTLGLEKEEEAEAMRPWRFMAHKRVESE